MSGQAISLLLAIVTIISSLVLIGFLVGSYVYKRMHNLPTGDCACCHTNTKKLLKKYHKANKKQYE